RLSVTYLAHHVSNWHKAAERTCTTECPLSGSLRKRGLRLRYCRGCLSLPRRREADVPHDVRAGRQDDAALLDKRLPDLSSETEMYDGQRTAHSHDGSTSTCWKPRRSGLTKIHRRCVTAARRSSIRSAH